VGEQVVSITWSYVPLNLILPDQPNRAVRTRMLRGVGGAACEGRSYPDSCVLAPPTSMLPCNASRFFHFIGRFSARIWWYAIMRLNVWVISMLWIGLG